MEIEILKEYIKLNLSQREIAKELNLSQSTIKYWLKKYNLSTKHISTKHKTPPICYKCGDNNPENFYKKNNGLYKKGYCKNCHNKHVIERMKSNKIKAVEYKGGCCKICGYNKCIEALDFHHKDPSTKDENWNRMKGWCLERIYTELDKCILLCCRCHREIHYDHTLANTLDWVDES